jgi:hypothetical protein
MAWFAQDSDVFLEACDNAIPVRYLTAAKPKHIRCAGFSLLGGFFLVTRTGESDTWDCQNDKNESDDVLPGLAIPEGALPLAIHSSLHLLMSAQGSYGFAAEQIYLRARSRPI